MAMSREELALLGARFAVGECIKMGSSEFEQMNDETGKWETISWFHIRDYLDQKIEDLEEAE